ncbi:MAG: T9SS type A sorting domain-containing protein [Ignavibacteria bacterium]|nr:T9SS type A sorting domain-containing protein [Ignavibacteria bacterium]
MKTALFISIILCLAIQSQLILQPDLAWEKRYNGPGNLQDNAYKVKCDNFGNVYVTGRSVGNGSGYDFCTIKYSSSGSQVWIQRYNGPGNGEDISVSLDLDNNNSVYVTGNSLNSSGNMDYCTMKYDSSGNLTWMRRYDEGFDDIPVAVEVDGAGNIYVTGSSENSSLNGCEKYLTLKYDYNGNVLWERKYDANITDPDIPADLTIDNNGNVIITGTSNAPPDWDDIATIKYSSSGEQLWVNRFSLPSIVSTDWGNAVITDDNGNAYVTGYSENFEGKMVTIKYNGNGALQWYKLYDNNAVDQGYDIDVYGNFIYVTGYTFGGKFLIVKYDNNGNQIWDRIFQEFESSYGYSAEIDNMGNIYATGYCLSTPSWDCLTLKYDMNGNLQWYKTYNGLNDSNDYANDLCLDNFGNLYVTGWSRGFNTSSDFITLKYSNLTPIQSVSIELPSQFSLSQNYPNPFNPSTTINFSIPSVETTRRVAILKIYNMLGSEVAALVNQQLTPGTYSVDWDASNFPSGVYFYRLSSGAFTQTNKMILLK